MRGHLDAASVLARELEPLLARLRENAPEFDVHLRVDPSVGTCAPGARTPCRQFAACEDTRPPTIYVAPRLAAEPIERVRGVLAHELGHAILFVAGQSAHSERDADATAERFLGVRIAYDRGDVQTTAAGKRPRPPHLG